MVAPEDFFSKEQIEEAKKEVERLRKFVGAKVNNVMQFMSEAELTEAQRESLEPIGTKGYFRMYRWECSQCNTNGRKRPYSVAIQEAYEHSLNKTHIPNIYSPPVTVRGGVFKKKDLNQY